MQSTLPQMHTLVCKLWGLNIQFFFFALTDAPPPLLEDSVPEHATYILVGAGTASFAAYRAIRKADKTAKVW